MAEEPPRKTTEPHDDGKKKKRRWPWVLAAVAVVLVILLIWLAGPGLNLIGTRVLRSQLAKAGLTGDFAVEEIGRSGVWLRDVDMAGPGLIRSLRGESLRVDYRLRELRHGQIQAIEARNFEVVLDLDAAPDRDDKPFDADALGDTLRAAQEELGAVNLDAQNVTIQMVRGDQPVTTIRGANIRHDAESETFHVRFEQILAEGGTVIENEHNPTTEPEIPEEVSGQDVEITWGPDGLRLERLELLPGIVLENLELRHAADEPLQAEGAARIGEAALQVRLEENLQTARVVLEGGPLDVSALMRLLDQEERLGGSVDSLQMTIENVLSPPGMWQATGSATARTLLYEEWDFDEVRLKLEKQDAIADFQLAGNFHGTPVTVLANARFQPELAEEADRWWHGAAFTGNMETGNLEPALAELRHRQDPAAENQPLPRGQLAMDFSAELQGEDLARAAADYRLHELAVAGETLPPVEGRAEWDPEARQVDATLRHTLAPEREGNELFL